jgi:hypothetical protein
MMIFWLVLLKLEISCSRVMISKKGFAAKVVTWWFFTFTKNPLVPVLKISSKN